MITGDVKRNGVGESWKEVVLRNGKDVEGCGEHVKTPQDGGGIISYKNQVAWNVVTSDDMAWFCWQELCWWCTQSLKTIRMVQCIIRDDSRVAYELCVKTCFLVLEDFLFFSLYSIACIARQGTTLTELRLLFCLYPSKQTLSTFVWFTISHYLLPISPMPDPANYRNTQYSIVWDTWISCKTKWQIHLNNRSNSLNTSDSCTHITYVISFPIICVVEFSNTSWKETSSSPW